MNKRKESKMNEEKKIEKWMKNLKKWMKINEIIMNKWKESKVNEYKEK